MTPSFIGLNRTMLPGARGEHLLGGLADGFDLAVDLLDGHNRRLVDHDARPRAETQVLAVRVDARSLENNERGNETPTPLLLCRPRHARVPG